jgi:GNAT superfamily N-acetyltransferase
MPDRLTFRQITNPADPAVGAMTRIYCEAIVAAERKPDEWIAEAVGRGDFRVVAASCNDQVVAMATAFVPGDASDWALFEYLAVDERFRGRGIGAGIFRHVVDLLVDRAVLLEVDSDRDPSPLQHERTRRLAFYRRMGARRVRGLRYILPLDADPPPPGMELLIANPPVGLDVAQLREWVSVVYERVYRKSRDDQRIKLMFDAISDPLRLD